MLSNYSMSWSYINFSYILEIFVGALTALWIALSYLPFYHIIIIALLLKLTNQKRDAQSNTVIFALRNHSLVTLKV